MTDNLEKQLLEHMSSRLEPETKTPLVITPSMIHFWHGFGLQECKQYRCAIDQRQDEVRLGWGKIGTAGFQAMGCYQCKGYDPICHARYCEDENDKSKIIKYLNVIGEMEE